MLPLLLASALTAAGSACPDLLVTNPRLKVVGGESRGYDHEIVTVDVRNHGPVSQAVGIRQRLELLKAGQLIGSQPIPSLGPDQTYVASFRLRIPHERKRRPLTVTFQYVLGGGEDAARNNCSTANDVLTVTL